MPLLDSSRRAYVHTVSVAIVTLLTAWALVGDVYAPLIPAAVLAFFDLAVALAHRDTLDWKGKAAAAFYALCLALQPIGLALSFGTDAQWGAALTVVSAVLGGSLAAGRAPTPA
ncbi:hypothetical protein K8O93_01270 [Gordonia bronchialis]|uniref:phage holin n=1 Tax=Gordonia bronchialis TaxID=2054 RepID=UPI001CBEFBED|nr:hypothetical protein [Gordonia bronchialis]UAK38465.1 hypothetical protein K8O93_01270 [Gordonia bronchialis]